MSIELEGNSELGLTHAVSFSGLYKTLKVLHHSDFIGFEILSTRCIRLFSAAKMSIMDERPELIEIHEDSNYQLNSATPELLTNYLGDSVSDRNIILKLKRGHGDIFSNIYRIARANHQPAKTVLVYKHDESGQYIELQSEETFARFRISESYFDDEFQAAMSFDDFKAFKSVASKMVTARICGVTLDVTMSNIFLSQDTVHAQFSCISLACLLYTSPSPRD